MKEELIRVENGRFRRDEGEYRFEISISRGECIGIYVDDHFTSGTAYLDVFKGVSRMEGGRAFALGQRVGASELERWIAHSTRIVDRHRFDSRELTVRDFILALDRAVDPAAPLGGRAAGKSGDGGDAGAYGAAAAARAPSDGAEHAGLLPPVRVPRMVLAGGAADFGPDHGDIAPAGCSQADGVRAALLRQGTAVFLFDLDDAFMFRYCDRIDVIPGPARPLPALSRGVRGTAF